MRPRATPRDPRDMSSSGVEELLASAPSLFVQAVHEVDKCSLWARNSRSTDMIGFKMWIVENRDALQQLYHTKEYVNDTRRATVGCALNYFCVD